MRYFVIVVVVAIIIIIIIIIIITIIIIIIIESPERSFARTPGVCFPARRATLPLLPDASPAVCVCSGQSR